MFTHFDIVVLIAVCFGVIFGGLVYVGWEVRQIKKSTMKNEGLTRAVGSLVVQETAKIRTLLNR